jgi:hypothetical protein
VLTKVPNAVTVEPVGVFELKGRRAIWSPSNCQKPEVGDSDDQTVRCIWAMRGDFA